MIFKAESFIKFDLPQNQSTKMCGSFVKNDPNIKNMNQTFKNGPCLIDKIVDLTLEIEIFLTRHIIRGH